MASEEEAVGAAAVEQPSRPIAVLKCSFDLVSDDPKPGRKPGGYKLAQRFAEVRGHFPNAHKLKAVDSARRRESGYPMSALRNEVESPHSIAQPLVKLVPEVDHDVDRVDGVGTGVRPIGPIVLAIGSSERVDLKALRHCGLVAR